MIKQGVVIMAVLGLALAFGFGLVSCGQQVAAGEAEQHETEEHGHAYVISLEPTGHIHTYRESALTFKVATEDGQIVNGLSPTVGYQFQSSDTMRESKEGDVFDNNDGTYTWKKTFNDTGVYVVAFNFPHEGLTHSKAFPIETSKAGGERIYCPDKDNPKFVYQVRWEAVPGHIHSGGEVTFEVELKRSFNKEINTEQPWSNKFDHLTPQDLRLSGGLPEIAIASAGGETPLKVQYAGMGIYEVKHKFGHISEETLHWLNVGFKDECGHVDESGAGEHDYQFKVVPEH